MKEKELGLSLKGLEADMECFMQAMPLRAAQAGPPGYAQATANNAPT